MWMEMSDAGETCFFSSKIVKLNSMQLLICTWMCYSKLPREPYLSIQPNFVWIKLLFLKLNVIVYYLL